MFSWLQKMGQRGGHPMLNAADAAKLLAELPRDDPLKATYVLAMDYADWRALHEGYDAQRTVMYRKILLEQGDLLEFFKAIYFFVESLSVVGAVPAAYP